MNTIKSLGILLVASIALTSCSHSKYLKKFHREAKKEATNATVKMKGDTVRVIYPELSMFDFSKDQIKEDAKPYLQRFAKVLVKYDRINFVINGYTDSIGGDDVNLSLSRNRAENTKAFMQSNGVNDTRMQTNGMGSQNPMSTNATEEGRRNNRRVEFLLYEKK